MAYNLSGLKIRARRRAAGLTQRELAGRAAISPSYLNLIELNKRPAPSAVMERLAASLGVERAALEGEAERRLIANLEEIAADPAFAKLGAYPPAAGEFAGRYPAWAELVLALHRAWLDESEAVLALADRLNRDPFLGESVHRMLTHAASIRAASEILQADPHLSPDERGRFLSIVNDDVQKLSSAAQSLLEFFDSSRIRVRSATPAEHVDAFILASGNYFPELEARAEEFLTAQSAGDNAAAAAERLLATRNASLPEPANLQAAETRRFVLVRHALRDAIAKTIEGLVSSHPALASDESRRLAASALEAYAAAAALMPYQPFLEAAERWRYDIDGLCRLFGVSYEQAAHRLATLRRPGQEGVRFAFMRSDVSGYVTKRLPLPRLPLPRYGNACPRWMIYAAFQTPGVTARGFGALPSGDEFLFFARAVEKQPASVGVARHLLSVMLACSAEDAARVGYGDGIDRRTATAAVGTICRLCPRSACAHRQEAPLIT